MTDASGNQYFFFMFHPFTKNMETFQKNMQQVTNLISGFNEINTC